MNGCYFKTPAISDNEGCQGTLNQGTLNQGTLNQGTLTEVEGSEQWTS
jgi:hypothetical protein